ncbi:hypothetical protein JHK87_050670 [Glycine soja]|nr:hypothetical protein JHK87_050670 [Glycine soja]
MEDNESILEKSKQLKTYYEISLSMDMISLANGTTSSRHSLLHNGSNGAQLAELASLLREPPQVDDLLESNLLTPLNGARIVYLDGRLHETALIVAHEAIKKNIHGLDIS